MLMIETVRFFVSAMGPKLKLHEDYIGKLKEEHGLEVEYYNLLQWRLSQCERKLQKGIGTHLRAAVELGHAKKVLARSDNEDGGAPTKEVFKLIFKEVRKMRLCIEQATVALYQFNWALSQRLGWLQNSPTNPILEYGQNKLMTD